MQITTQVKLLPSSEQLILIENTAKEYISTVNNIVKSYVAGGKDVKYSSKNVIAELPSALKNQAIQDAKSVFKKYTKAVKLSAKKAPDKQKEVKLPILKKPMSVWNNQNYSIEDNSISFPVWLNGKSTKISVKAVITDYQAKLITNKLGTLRITNKSGKHIAQIAVNVEEKQSIVGQAMGIDLGLKIPAVAVTQNSKTKFYGNGRLNKYTKRKNRAIRKKLGKLKKQKAINKLDNKEQRWMRDQDHKISRNLVNQGIKVEYVDPKYTSQICPVCGKKNKAKDRKYKCDCGFKSHRDRVGAINIISAPVIDGNSLSA